MSKIPPELEDLMWTLAEAGNPQAVSEFEARFPHLKIELAKRTSMVRSLKSTRPDNVTTPAIPRFVPGPAPAAGPSRGMYTASFVFAAIALSVFAYTAVLAHRRQPLELPRVEKTDVRPPTLPPSTDVVEKGSQTAPWPNNAPTVSGGPTDQSNPGGGLKDEPPVIPAPTVHSWERPQSIAMRNVPLQSVLQAVAEEGKLSIDMAPGMPNPTITVDYHDISAQEILKDLGRTYVFTPILSDDGSAIMIPAVARNTGAPGLAKFGSGN